jgi:hypothetical protein
VLSPPGGVYASGTVVTLYVLPNLNSSASLYKDGVLFGTSNTLITTTVPMHSDHTASVVVGWRDVQWQVAANPVVGGSPYGPSGLTSGYAKMGEVITITANPTDSTFVSWSYSNSVPTTPTSATTEVTLSVDSTNQFTANYSLNTYIITAKYSGTTGTSSFTYYDSAGNIQTYYGTGVLGGTVVPDHCGRFVSLLAGTADQTIYQC